MLYLKIRSQFNCIILFNKQGLCVNLRWVNLMIIDRCNRIRFFHVAEKWRNRDV